VSGPQTLLNLCTLRYTKRDACIFFSNARTMVRLPPRHFSGVQGAKPPRRELKEVRATTRLVPFPRASGLRSPYIVGLGLPLPWSGVGQPLMKRFHSPLWGLPPTLGWCGACLLNVREDQGSKKITDQNERYMSAFCTISDRTEKNSRVTSDVIQRD
jgi:hypothetical protein